MACRQRHKKEYKNPGSVVLVSCPGFSFAYIELVEGDVVEEVGGRGRRRGREDEREGYQCVVEQWMKWIVKRNGFRVFGAFFLLFDFLSLF